MKLVICIRVLKAVVRRCWGWGWERKSRLEDFQVCVCAPWGQVAGRETEASRQPAFREQGQVRGLNLEFLITGFE